VYSLIAIVRQSLAAANEMCGLRRKLRQSSSAVATSLKGQRKRGPGSPRQQFRSEHLVKLWPPNGPFQVAPIGAFQWKPKQHGNSATLNGKPCVNSDKIEKTD
jgi:hypothetical protein